MRKIVEQWLEPSAVNKNCMILVGKDEEGQKWVLSGNYDSPYAMEYDYSILAKREQAEQNAMKFMQFKDLELGDRFILYPSDNKRPYQVLEKQHDSTAVWWDGVIRKGVRCYGSDTVLKIKL